MDIDTDQIATSDILVALLKNPLGHITFSESALYMRQPGSSVGRQLFNNGKFFHKRLVEHPDSPINAACQERMTALYEAIFAGTMPKYKPELVATRLLHALEEVAGTTRSLLNQDPSPFNEDDGKKLVALVNAVLATSLNKQFVSRKELRERFRAVLQQPTAAAPGMTEQGVTAFYHSVDEVRYPQKISDARHVIDIVHFHGLTWTNMHREQLRGALALPGMHVRVSLADPEGEFFEPYAHFINVDPGLLRAKTQEALGIWRTLYAEAAQMASDRGQSEMGKLDLYLNQGFPAKSIYRFDDEVIVTPANNSAPKPQFLAFSCHADEDNDRAAFNSYERELSWLFGSGAKLAGCFHGFEGTLSA